MEIKYRDGMDADFLLLCGELDDYMLSFPDVDQSAYSRYSAAENIRDAFVAYVDGTPAGCAAYRGRAEGAAELKRVFVREQYRGQGISAELVTAVETRVRAEGYRAIELGTLLTLVPAVCLYRSLGYRQASVEGLYVCMEKALEPKSV